MGELLIQEGAFFHSVLNEKFKCNEQRTFQMRGFAISIIQLFGGFSSEITNACRKYFKRLKVDQSEDQSIIFLSKYIIDILNELSKKITLINKNIESDIIQPLNFFIENQNKNHVETLRRSEEMLYSIENNNQLLKQLNKNYQVNQSSMTKSFQQKFLLKNIVESQIQKCNTKWHQIKGQYQKILIQLDSYNSARCNFTMKTQISIVRYINRLVNSASVDESLQQYEQFFCDNETLSIQLKDQMRDKLGKLIIFEEMGDTDIYQIIASEVDQKEKYIIDDFIGFFTSRSNLKEEQKNFEQSRSLILQDMRWTNYFLTKLKSSLHMQIKLNNIKFRQLATIVKYIFALVVQVQQNEGILYNLLYISYKVRHKDQYLIKQLGKHQDFWRNVGMWRNIIQHIRNIKAKGRNHDEYQPRRHLRLRKLFSRSNWIRSKMVVEKKIKSQKVIQDAKMYEVLCEVNYYMAKLQIQQNFIFQFMLNQTSKHHISKQNTRKLLQFHYMNKMIFTNKVSSNYLKRKERIQQKYKNIKNINDKLIICIGKSLIFLPVNSQLMNILLVNQRWSNDLKDKVLKRILIQEKNHALCNKLRLSLYREICIPPFSRVVYQKMINQVPSFTQHTEIINLDARRSLGWDQKLRVQMIEILKTFSYYHPQNGYLQGMNYLCENILKLTDDTYACYAIFQHLMNNQYYNLYTGNFEGLKITIYQFMRIVERERPELYEHLRAEKLEGEHFLLSWAITLWGQMSGELCWILWDGFLLKGWQWWFKTCLWLLKVLQPQLIKMNFQQIMKCFSDLHSSLFSYTLDELSQYGIQKSKIKSEIDSIRIEKQLLTQIEKEYKLKANMINDYMKSIETKKKQ